MKLTLTYKDFLEKTASHFCEVIRSRINVYRLNLKSTLYIYVISLYIRLLYIYTLFKNVKSRFETSSV